MATQQMSGRPVSRLLVHAKRGGVILALVGILLVLAACAGAGAPAAGSQAAETPTTLTDVIQPLEAYRFASPIPTPTATPAISLTAGISGTVTPTTTLNVVISTQGLRANLRSGPGTNFEIVTKANPGQVFEVTGRSDNGAWYQVKLNAPVAGGKTQTAWVSKDVVRQGGAGEAPVVAAATDQKILLDSDLTANWRVDWSCASQRCEIKKCGADVKAAVTREPLNNYLPVEHTVTWDDKCFSTDAWTFEVDEYTGQERSGEAKDNFLYSYWMGAKPGEANGVLPLDGAEGIAVYCSGPHSVEIEEGGGWTTVYEGNTCHDVNTGLLVFMNYTKRWLFTGDHEGRTYERAYFGDSEKLEQRLVESSAPLTYVKEK